MFWCVYVDVSGWLWHVCACVCSLCRQHELYALAMNTNTTMECNWVQLCAFFSDAMIGHGYGCVRARNQQIHSRTHTNASMLSLSALALCHTLQTAIKTYGEIKRKQTFKMMKEVQLKFHHLQAGRVETIRLFRTNCINYYLFMNRERFYL